MTDKFKIGHFTDAENGTGVTVILAEEGAVGGVSVRGAAPATRETDLLRCDKTVEKINAVVLSGGSAFGLEAACGVVEYLKEKGLGYNAGKYRVPIVVGASVYDLEYKSFAYPDKAAGYKAAENAVANNFIGGETGAAGGSTISKMLGMPCAVKTGLGIQTYKMNDLEIAVIVVVNALGDVVKNGEILAGAVLSDGSFADSQRIISSASLELKNQNTTIGCIITNAKLTKIEANILADIAHDGLARAVSPSHTRFDGDAFFCMASGEVKEEFNILTGLIPGLTEKAIQASVTTAEPIEKRVDKFLMKVFRRMWKSK